MTITRINSFYGQSSSPWDRDYERHNREKREQHPDHISIWGNSSLYGSGSNDFIGANNGIQNVNYAPKGASFVPMDQVMTAPFGANTDILGTNHNSFNPFESSNFNSTSIFSNAMRAQDYNNFLSLTGQHPDHHAKNIFRNNNVNSHHSNDLHFKQTTIKRGNFGSQTMSNRLTSIHTPSVDFTSRDLTAGNKNISQTNISGHINSYKQTIQHLNTPTADLDRTRQVIKTPTEKITRTVTKGTLWV